MDMLTSRTKASILDLYKYRFVIKQFAIRDIKVRYSNTYLGYLWAILNPLFTFIIYIIAFGLIIKIPTSEYNTDYYIVLLCGIFIWSYFNQATDTISSVLIHNITLLNKVYFPRMTLNLAALSVSSVDFIISTIVLIILFLCIDMFHDTNLLRLMFIPLLYVGISTLSLGIGSILAILKMKYKDFRHLVPMIFQALFFISPIVYTPSLVSKDFIFLYNLNPFVGYLEFSRWIFIHDAHLDILHIIYSLLVSIVISILGLYFFNQNERAVVEKI
ncbi:ABC transporter permease [Candidatus Enterovibrio altilux]|uniref:ABC transporter permease n=1 Tax=Candidatus Enterovibrio altilux TaxID=1927128 RepID=UPI001237FBE2|nr:ABC transporter permease [Candidatus Enterovibrio luxaltus]